MFKKKLHKKNNSKNKIPLQNEMSFDKHYLNWTQREVNLFIKLLQILTDIDKISDKKRHNLFQFFRVYYKQYKTEDFIRLFSSNSQEKIFKKDVVSSINNSSPDSILKIVLQAFSCLLEYEASILPLELKENYTSVLNDINLDQEEKNTITSFFFNKERTIGNILYINSKDDSDVDIIKGTKGFSMAIIATKYGYNIVLPCSTHNDSSIENSILFDNLLYKIEDGISLFINSYKITNESLKLRFKLKREFFFGSYLISPKVDKDNNNNYEIYLEPELKTDDRKILGVITVQKCRVFAYNRDGFSHVSIGDFQFGKNLYNGCLDDQIKISNKVSVNVLALIDKLQKVDKLELLSMDESIRVIKIGNTEECTHFIPFNLNEKELNILENQDDDLKVLERVEKPSYIELKELHNNSWTLYIKNANTNVLNNGILVSDDFSEVSIGDVIQLDHYYISFIPDSISVSSTQVNSVNVNQFSYQYKNSYNGVKNISFSNSTKDMVCIMGPSGSGKSTLLKLITSFITSDDFDSIQLNGNSLYRNFNQFKQRIGYVPQDDLLFENLTVYENIYHYGKVKQPNLSNQELNKRIDNTLLYLGLESKKDSRVGSPEKRELSGGERKRLNIALEIVTDCDILILDEPTSGLSSFDTLKLVEFLKKFSYLGKIIYTVIHQPSKEVFNKFTHLIMLDKGGYLVYFGKTDRSYGYFSKYSDKPIWHADGFLEVMENTRKNSLNDLVFEIENGIKKPSRVRSPRQWNEEFQIRLNKKRAIISSKIEKKESKGNLPKVPKLGFKQMMSQWQHLFLRNFKNRFKDKTATMLSVVLPLIIALIMGTLLRTKDIGEPYTYSFNKEIPKFFFLTSIIFIFFAISNSVNEIFKDKPFLEKEKLIGYSMYSYLTTKLITLAIIGLYQIAIYIMVSFPLLDIPIAFFYQGHLFAKPILFFYLMSFIGFLSATALGLFVSSLIKTEKSAFLMIPLLIVPQIIFGGTYLKFSKMQNLNIFNHQKPVPVITTIIHSRWMYESFLYTSRFDSPNKYKHFGPFSGFRDEKGDYNNREVNSLFATYFLSDIEDDDKKEEVDRILKDQRNEFLKVLERLNKDDIVEHYDDYLEGWLSKNTAKLTISEFLNLYYKKPMNYFPSELKLLYPFIINARTFASFHLLLLFFIFFFGTIIILKRRNKINIPKHK